MKSVATTLLFLATAYAQSSSTISFWWPMDNIDQQPLVASVVDVADARTTLAMVCSDPSDSDNCGVPVPMTLTEASDYFDISWTFTKESEGGVVSTLSVECTVGRDASATCTDSGVTTAFAVQGLGTTLSVVVTAGVEKLASAGAAATGASAMSTSASTRASASASSTVTESGSALATSSTSTPVETSSAESSGTPTGSAATGTATGAAASNTLDGASFAGFAGLIMAALAL